jgi:hypothetical protein
MPRKLAGLNVRSPVNTRTAGHPFRYCDAANDANEYDANE